MIKSIEGKLVSKDYKYAIIVSRFNELITSKLLSGAIDCLKRHGANEENVNIVWVPGAFEIPYVARKIVDTGEYDSVICLGCVIRGDTPHFDYVASEVSKGVASIGVNSSIPVIFGVLTTDNIDQAIARAGSKSGNKGWEAALAAIEMINLYKEIK